MDLSIIIVTHNSLTPIEKCLGSLQSHPPSCSHEVIIVDNASGDGTPRLIARKFGEFTLECNRENRGYSKGVNQGIGSSSGKKVLIINPDIEVREGSIDRLIEFMDEHPRVGIAGAKLLYPDGRLQYSCRSFYTIKTLILRRTILGKLFPRARALRKHLLMDYDHEQARRVDWVLGACMMVRREAIEQVGPMDERFFLYFEDTDWCFRMNQHGWDVFYVPRAEMVHLYERSSAASMLKKPFLLHLLSLLRYYEKWDRVFYFFRRRRGMLKGLVFFLADLVAMNLSFLAAYYLRAFLQPWFTFGLYPLSWYQYFIFFYHLVFILTFIFAGLYRIRRETTSAQEFAQVTRALMTVFAILLVSTYLTRYRIFSRAVLSGHAVFSVLAVFSFRYLIRRVHQLLVRSNFDLKRVVLSGNEEEIRGFSSVVAESPRAGIDIVGMIGDQPDALGSWDQFPALVEKFKIQELIILPSSLRDKPVTDYLTGLDKRMIDVRIVSPLARFMPSGVRVEELNGTYMFSIDRGTRQLLTRGIARMTDIMVALCLLPLSAVLTAICRVGGRLFGGVRFFREERFAGGGGKVNWPRGQKKSGREIPDIFKVELYLYLLSGRLGLVGPPPLLPSWLEPEACIPGSYRPGITGKWRVASYRNWRHALEGEILEYGERSVSDYLFILLRSVKACLSGGFPQWFHTGERD
ncbi:MAG: glycosyltransferase [Candidatus Krumholzibacteriota bacterium]|nr:glycosyltransferase [Candidatus Krumholzibacteriota bacterium]